MFTNCQKIHTYIYKNTVKTHNFGNADVSNGIAESQVKRWQLKVQLSFFARHSPVPSETS